MKRLLFVILITLFLVLPALSQDDADREIARTQDYIAAATKKGTAKINALKAYITKFPEESSKWTKLALYQLAIEYYSVKNYGEAVKQGEKRLKVGGFGKGEEGRLTLVVANSLGIKNTPQFNKDKALKYTNKAIALAKKDGDNAVLKAAQGLKKSLSGPPPKVMSPEQKMKMHYSNDEYSEAISYYKTLGASDKANIEIHLVYANSLFRANRYDSALKEYQAIYAKEKRAVVALRMGDIYNKKGRRNKAMYENAATYYVHAGYLYKKDGNNSNSKVAFQKAQAALGDKYGFNRQVTALERKQKQNVASAKKNEQLIRRKERDLRKKKRELYRKYEAVDMLPPPHERDAVAKLEKEIKALKSGVSASDAGEADKLNELAAKIRKELDALKSKVKKELGV